MSKFRKTMALLLALALVLTTFGAVTVSAASFSDTNGHWAEGVIDKWSSAGVVNGYSDGTFLPDNNITRAELAKVISTARQYTGTADINFSDVSADDWYADSLAKCVAQGVIGGYEDGTFRPDNNVTREEAATMFQRAYQVNAHGLISFADGDSISAWAQTAVTALVGSGVINGYEDGTFRPADSITRAEVVKILDGISAVGTEPGTTVAPGGNEVSSGTVVSGGLGGSGNSGGYNPGYGSGGSGGNGSSGYTVRFIANGGTFANGKDSTSVIISKNGVIGGAEPAVTRIEAAPVETAGPEASADPTAAPDITYTLAGWYKTKAAADALDESQKWDIDNDIVTAGMTLYAGWYLEGMVTVLFETNGGYPEIEQQKFASGEYAAKPADPAREHYTFLGWYESNDASTQFDFNKTAVKANKTLYAKWSVNSEFAGKEITMPNKTVGSYTNGTITAAPVSALPGETVKLTVTPPENYMAESIKSLTYTSSATGAKTNISGAAIAYGVITFVLPDDVVDGTIEVEVGFVPGTAPTLPPPGTPAPTATPEPKGNVVEYISDTIASVYGASFPQGENYNGLTASGAVEISDSSKTFSSGLNIETGESVSVDSRKYSKRFRVNKLITTVRVQGPCSIRIDAASGNNESNRNINIKVGSKNYGAFTCEGGAATACLFNYDGSEGEVNMVLTPADAVQIYGIILDYGDFVPPTPTPIPTPDPGKLLKITSNTTGNGSVTTSASESVYGQTVTVVPQPDAGYKTVGILTNPTIPTTDNGDGTYSFDMPYSDITVTARIVPAAAEEHLVSVDQPEVGGTVSVQPVADYIKQTLIDSTEDFMMYNHTGGGWIVSSDGLALDDPAGDPTVVESKTAVKDNKTNMMVLKDKAVQYDLGTPLGKGPFTLTYDMLITGANKRSFRTYFDNAANPYDKATGKASASGTENAFFHMTDINNRLYVTKDVSDIEAEGKSAPRSGVRIGKNDLENEKWYRFVITGNIGDDTVTVKSYRHSLTGEFVGNVTSSPENISEAAPFITGRNASLKQLKFVKTENSTLYFDNINLVNYNDDYMRAYDGDEFVVTAEPVNGYELGGIVVKDAAGNSIPVDESGKFAMPSSDAVVSAIFVPETPADPPAGLVELTKDYAFIADENISGTVKSEKFFNDNTFYMSGGNNYAGSKGSNVIGDYGSHKNVTSVNAPNAYMAFKPAFDAQVTVYTEQKGTISVIAGVKPGSAGLYGGTYNITEHTFTVPAGTCVFISAVDQKGRGQEFYIGGVVITHAASASAVELDESEPAEAKSETIEDIQDAETEDAAVSEDAAEAEPEADAEAEDIEAQEEIEETELPTPDEAAQAE